MTVTIKHEISKNPGPEVEVACVRCSGKTAHAPLVSVQVHGSDGDGGHSFDWHNEHQIVQCLGCKSLSYRIVSSNSEEYNYDENGNCVSIESEKFYPPRLEGVKGLGDETMYLPLKGKRPAVAV